MAKTVKAKKRISRFTLNRGKPDADLPAQLGTEHVKFHFVAHEVQEIGQRKLRTRTEIANFINAKQPVTVRINPAEDRSRCLGRPDKLADTWQGGPVQVEQLGDLFGAARADAVEHPLSPFIR